MNKYSKKTPSSPLVLIVPLIIAITVVIGAAIVSNTTTQTKSKAEFNPSQQCTKLCSASGNTKTYIKDSAACALDCPAVVSGEMTCTNFCNENVERQAFIGPTKKAGGETPNSTISVCKQQCNSWVADPCAERGAVCKDALGQRAAKSQCQTQCNLVQSDTKTCAEAMTAESLSAVNASVRPKVLQNCKTYFE